MVSGSHYIWRLLLNLLQHLLQVPQKNHSAKPPDVPFSYFNFLYKGSTARTTYEHQEEYFLRKSSFSCSPVARAVLSFALRNRNNKTMEHYMTAFDLGMILEFAVPEVDRYCTADLADKCKALYRAVSRLNDYTMLTISGEDEELKFFSPFSHDWEMYQAELRSQIEESD